MSRPTVGVIGTGAMGEALVSGLRRAGWEPGEVRITGRRPGQADGVAERHGATVVGDTEAAAADVLILAVKPPDVVALVDAVSGSVDARTVVVSLAVGVGTSTIQGRLGHGVPVVRAMPNTPALVGSGVTVLSAGAHAREEHMARVEEVFAAVGTTVRLPEHQQDAASTVSGSGPAYFFYLVDAMAEAGVLLGLGRDIARDLAVRTALGAATMMLETGRHPVVLREQVTSPGGTTIAALRVFDERAVRAAIVDGMAAARARSHEIGAELRRHHES